MRQVIRVNCLLSMLTLVATMSNPLLAQQQDWIQMWVFNGRTESNIREGLKCQAEQILRQLKDNCSLSSDQHDKLKLAAAGDVDRFFHEVAKVRKATVGLDQQNQNAVQAAWAVVSPLQQKLNAGIYNDDSLFSKVMTNVLQASQIEQFKRLGQEQIERRNHALVLSTVSTIEDSLPLVGEQREKLIAMMDKQKVGKIPANSGLETYLGYAKLAKVPDADLEKVFDKDQLKTLRTIRERYAQFLPMFER